MPTNDYPFNNLATNRRPIDHTTEKGSSGMRLGIFGGSFNPVHYGHLLLAEAAREQCQLDEVWFVPSAVPPHKEHNELAPAEHRLAMLELAITGYEPFHTSRIELDRPGTSYTVDTLAALASETGRQLFFLLGADSLFDLPHWRRPEEICRLATLIVVARAGQPEPDLTVLQPLMPPGRTLEQAVCLVEMPQIGLAARELRARVAHGKSIRFRTPRAVEEYIAAHGLYRASSMA